MKRRKKRYLTGLLIAWVCCQQAACVPLPKEQAQEIQKEQFQTEAEKEKIEVARISAGNYAYEKLSDEERQVYDEILSAILNHQEEITLSCTEEAIMRRAYGAVCADYGGLFWVEGYVFTKYLQGEEIVGLEFAPSYTQTRKERKQTQQQIDVVVDKWLSGIAITDTDYDKVKYVYNLLSTKVEYAEGAPDSQNIVSVFLKGKTVCQGYACAAQYLLRQLGIESTIVTGTALGNAHAWNLFQMDGEYYYMDVTWGRGRYVEETVEKFFVDYKYMAMTAEEMRYSHIPNEELELPETVAKENGYYAREGKNIREWNPEKIGEMLLEAWTEKKMLVLRFADRDLYDKTQTYFVEEGRLKEYCPGIEEISYMQDEKWLEISFCF